MFGAVGVTYSPFYIFKGWQMYPLLPFVLQIKGAIALALAPFFILGKESG